MSEIEYGIPPYQVVDVVSSLDQARSQAVGWQIKAWMADKIHAEFGVTGEGVKVGIGDTGVSAIHMGGELSNVEDLRSFVGDSNPRDRNGHGSHCLGIIGAQDNETGMIGYAPDCKMYSAKVLSDRGSGGDRGIAQGIGWLAAQDCKIISLSLGSPQRSSYITGAVKDAHDAGVIVFCAAGNDGRTNDIDYPAAGGYNVPVGAIDSRLKLASFSDRGASLKNRGAVGPGVNVYSTVTRGYAAMSGTSMATPGLAGQCALYLSAEIKFLGSIKTNTLEKFLAVVDKYHLDLGAAGADSSFGRGAFDVYSAIKALAGRPEQPAPSPADWVTKFENEKIRLQVKE